MTFEIIAAIIFAGFIIYGLARIEMVLEKISRALLSLNNCLVHYLDDRGKVKLSDETAAKLRQYASRPMAMGKPASSEAAEAYELGLADGTTIACQFVIGELKEETENA
jgi:hypothetical protein